MQHTTKITDPSLSKMDKKTKNGSTISEKSMRGYSHKALSLVDLMMQDVLGVSKGLKFKN